ncbi:hypothetical protein [Treponema sp.]|uniref:hypothetical protein n=1 Tax=Treponema sp. TaxID=166 RepID=UPI00298DEE27|nr:hypothetical protein [Treponema sp.]MCR5612134.1 hypothetical protein [Treponema sp.]
MNFEEVNLFLKNKYLTKKTTANLEKYVLSELYVPIADYQNAVHLIIQADKELISRKLMFIELFISIEYLHCKSYYYHILKDSIFDLTEEEKALFYYLEALLFIQNNEKSEEEIIKLLDKSISYKVSFVANYIQRAKFEKNEKNKIKLSTIAFKNIKQILTINDCESNDNNDFYFDIDFYIDSEIKQVILTEPQVEILFGEFNILE